MEKLEKEPEVIKQVSLIEKTMKNLKPLDLPLNLWEAQNKYFSIGKELYSEMIQKAEQGDDYSKDWVDDFSKLGYYLHVKI